jgi:AcrR family transcriptional regulator
MASTPGAAPVKQSLRERKKLMTRQTLIDTAEEMFGERGFDNVTVAEIADAANVAAKTVFVYFPAKEDLVFHGEGAMAEILVARIREREPGQTPLDAVTDLLTWKMSASRRGPVDELDRVLRTVGENPGLHARMRLMWERFELAVATELADETGQPPFSPEPRVAAAQIIVVFRTMASTEVMEYIRARPKTQQRKTYGHWLAVAKERVSAGIQDYARRTD